MKDVVINLSRAFDHLETLEKLCGTIQRRVDNGMDITPEWLSSMTGLIKGNSSAAKLIISDEAAVANGFTRNFIAQIDKGIEMAMDGPRTMQVQSQDGNVVRIGPSTSYQTKGGDCA